MNLGPPSAAPVRTSERTVLPALDPTTYAAGHALFEARSDQRAMIVDWLDARLGRRDDASLSVLSVGCGDGSVDRRLATRAVTRGTTASWTGVEPHAPSAAAFLAALTPVVPARCRVGTFAAQDFTETYDVVTFVHSLYYVADLRAALTAALDRLSTGGELLVLHAPLGALNRLTDELAPDVEGHEQPWSDQVAHVLATLRADVRRDELAATVDLTGCDEADPALLDFLVQGRLDDAARSDVLATLAAIAEPGPGLRVAHPVTAFAVSR